MALSIVPYRGQQRTLYTDISAEECLRRLQRNVERGPFNDMDGWAQLTADHSLARRVDGQQFVVRKHPPAPVPWMFYGTIRNNGEYTVITGQYKLDRAQRILPAFGFLCMALIVGYISYQGILNDSSLQATVSQASPFLAGIVLLLGFLVWRNRVEGAHEQDIVRFLASYFRASELPPTGPGTANSRP